MPPKTEIKARTMRDLQRAIDKTIKDADNPTLVDLRWTQLYGAARDALSITHWRMLIAEQARESRPKE